MRILCFGGSFNPIHHGHLICARAVAEAKGFERVMLIPNAQSPLKENDPNWVTGQHRLRMCELAIQDDPLFQVDDIELRRPSPSYTIETVRELKQFRGWTEVNWLIGRDTIRQFYRWHQPQNLLSETNFVVMRRFQTVSDMESDELPQPPKDILMALMNESVETPLIEISATDIRRRVREGRSIEYLTPRAVCEYIRENRLYV